MRRTLWYILVTICCSGITCVTARRKRDKHGLKFSDCGIDADRPLRFFDVRASPVPIITPGTLYVSFRGNITEDLPRSVSIELGLIKYLIGIPFPLPCFDNNLGSCVYDSICERLKPFEVMGCPKTLKQYGVQCSCPFRAGEFNIRNLPLNIPNVRGIARALISVRKSGRKWINENCTLSEECLVRHSQCYLNICQCKLGYSYRHSTESCVESCDVYGSTFTIYQNYHLGGTDHKYVWNADNGDVCERACAKETSYNCLATEHVHGNKLCSILRTSARTNPELVQPYSGIDYYHRNCQ